MILFIHERGYYVPYDILRDAQEKQMKGERKLMKYTDLTDDPNKQLRSFKIFGLY